MPQAGEGSDNARDDGEKVRGAGVTRPLYKGDLLTVLYVNLPAHVALGWVP
jgi:hypothetical protein